MKQSSAFTRQVTATILLVALVVRAAIPAGFMPASPGSGLLSQLCPAGMPAAFFAGSEHASHHAEHAENAAHPKHSEHGGDGTPGAADRCPVGDMLSSAFAVGDFWLVAAQSALPVYQLEVVSPAHSLAPAAYRSRGPPA